MNLIDIPNLEKLFLALIKIKEAVEDIASPLILISLLPFLTTLLIGFFIALPAFLPNLLILKETTFILILNLFNELFIEATILSTLFLTAAPPLFIILFIDLILLFTNLNTEEDISSISLFDLNLTYCILIPKFPNPF